ncbi:MAG: hypothetical protein AABX00_03850 [Nanoarchaeota archaeon]
MKPAIILTIFLLLIGGCSTAKTTILGTQELLLDAQDLQQLGMKNNGTDCLTEEYPTNEFSPLAQYSFCDYTINSLNDTEVIIQLQKFTNLNDLNGTYQYSSQHYRSVEGLISVNDYGDQSRFYLNNENDYGGQYNDPNIYYYTLYITKDEYLIQITSKGSSKEAAEYISKIGRQILSKFG